MVELGTALRELAREGAPPPFPAAGLWERGRRLRRRRRSAGAIAAVLAVVALGSGTLLADRLGDDNPPPVSPPGGGHLPKAIHAPDPWSAGTADVGEIGPLAVLSTATRKRPEGWSDKVEYSSLFGIAATDGTARFLDIPTSDDDRMPGEMVFGAALSPDGRKVGFTRRSGSTPVSDGHVVGWGVYDTSTGRITTLSDPAVPRPRESGADLRFTGDSRYLLTDYAPTSGDRNHALVAWDVETGKRFVAEGPGHYWIPNLGAAPSGVVWSRGDRTFTFDPKSGARTSITTGHDVVEASFAPVGTGFAYIGGTLTEDGIDARTWRLYAGPRPDRVSQVRDVRAPGRILGWRDATHAVVSMSQGDYAVVDISSGAVERAGFRGEVNLYSQSLAADLWREDLVPGVVPPGASDPRSTARRLILAGGASLALVLVLAARRRRRRG